MKDGFEINFSNRLELLYQKLKASLFQPASPPLLRRMVIVYGQQMKEWLTLRMAQDPDLSVSMGIEFVYYGQAFETMLQLSKGIKHDRCPSLLEISFAIETEISSVVSRFSSLSPEEQQDWMPVMRYLGLKIKQHAAMPSMTRKAKRRLIGLSDHLARLFQDYGRYAAAMTVDWERPDQQGWQARLWRRLYLADNQWEYPGRSLQQEFSPEQFSLHVFSISFIPPVEFRFLSRLAESIPVHYYLLSPCALFWSDIRSDRECLFLENAWRKRVGTDSASVLELEDLLSNRNSLLANFGRIGREMALQIEESEAVVHSMYSLPEHSFILHPDHQYLPDLLVEPTDSPLSLLHALQSDLLLMRNPEKELPFCFDQEDRSIQLHAAPCKRREIEILYNNIMALMQTDSTLLPQDILVAAPEIEEYIPYIESVFGSHESQLDYQVADVSLKKDQDLAQGFMTLLELSEGRWNAQEVLQFFGNPAFQRCHQISKNDLEEIRKWIEESGIRWGHDQHHRNEILKQRHCLRGMVDETVVGTWDHGTTRLLLNLAVFEDGSSVDFSDGELLGKWIWIMRSLLDDLSPLRDGSQMILSDWASYLKCLFDSYLRVDYESYYSLQEADRLMSAIDLLVVSSPALCDEKFAFDSVKIRLLSILEAKGSVYREERLQAVKFCSLTPLRSIPSRVVAVLGMQEDAFPRTGHRSSLNLMLNDPNCDFCPLPTDFDRYLFLEILHSAQEYLLFSYCRFNESDQKEQNPSLLTDELFSYLDKHYTIQGCRISEKCCFQHPFDAFDPLYFSGEPGYYGFSFQDYRAANARSSSLSQSYLFLKDWNSSEKPLKEVFPSNSYLNLRDLASLARDPIKFHFNKTLSVYLQNPSDRIIKTDEEIMISDLDRYLLKQDAGQKSIDEVLESAELSGKLPFGMFKDIAGNQVKQEVEEFERLLQKFSLDVSDVFEIELSPHCKSPLRVDERRWLFPPLMLSLDEGLELAVIGKIPYASKRGLLFLGKSTIPDVWKIWPQYLLFSSILKDCPDHWKADLIPLNSAKPLEGFLDDPLIYMKRFVHYYGFSLQHFSFLMPDLLPLILDGDEEALKIKIKDLLSGAYRSYQNPYLPRILDPKNIPDACVWKEKIQWLAGSFIRHWFPSKIRSTGGEIHEAV